MQAAMAAASAAAAAEAARVTAVATLDAPAAQGGGKSSDEGFGSGGEQLVLLPIATPEADRARGVVNRSGQGGGDAPGYPLSATF
jgi:hypothetical protein